MEYVNLALNNLYQSISEKGQRPPITFKEYLKLASELPEVVFRDIFRLFHDMIDTYVNDGVNEYPDDPESINYVYYDCSRLFVEGADHPFFADRLFANRLINLVSSFSRGIHQNRIYIFEGPHGCGKSTFLNNLLMKFEQFSNTEEGATYEILWRLDKEELGLLSEHEAHAILTQLRSLVDGSKTGGGRANTENLLSFTNKKYLEVPCPSHDHPILLIPRNHRKDVLFNLIKDEKFKKKLFTEKQYEWILRKNPCTVCMSLYQTLLDKMASPADIFKMVFARRYQFNRRLGEGISVFNPGDKSAKAKVMTNHLLQNQLNSLLRDSNRVNYIFSRYAKTNNGIYALMDIKANNRERFENLHGIISEGVHKVEDIEEDVNSLFLALLNPEDHQNVIAEQSFADRITYIKIPYVLDYNTEVKIYLNAFGDQIEKDFLPRVLHNFAKVIISSRLKLQSEGLAEWIGNTEKYKLYCDENLQLLKMDIYAGYIPSWLSEEDRKKFTAKIRKKIIAESEFEGNAGISGRDSQRIFNEFYSTYAKKDKIITMAMVHTFFEKYHKDLAKAVPDGFMDSLIRHYNYTVLQEVKEALYYYNEERISRDIQNYLFSINFEPGIEERCVYTGEYLEISEDFFRDIELKLLGSNIHDFQRISFRKDIQKQYTSKTLTQEINMEGKNIVDTSVYKSLHERYVHNLKENVLDPFINNDNFRSAVKDYALESFKTYDRRIREEVTFLMRNLQKKYGYNEQGAKEVCIYVIDNNLASMFPHK